MAEEAADTSFRADFAIDRQWQRLIRNWDFNGNITALRGRLFTPYFPLRNRLNDVDVTFNTQKLDINNITYRVGKSDLQLTGAVDNIRSTLLGSRRNPLTISLVANSRTLDLNELMAALYKGNNFANNEEQKLRSQSMPTTMTSTCNARWRAPHRKTPTRYAMPSSCQATWWLTST